MGRHCSVCARPDVGEVGEALRSGRSARSVALGLGVADDAVGRHARNHLGRVRHPAVPPGARAAILRALEPFPDALEAVLRELGEP